MADAFVVWASGVTATLVLMFWKLMILESRVNKEVRK